jgi:arsenate reductase (glutaredoxin)
MAITLYGIPNCDTVKKARAWLDGQGVAYAFHDFKKAGVPADRLEQWADAVGWDKLLNRQGTTWRKLDAAVQAGAADRTGALRLMREQPSLIKRPVVDWPGRTTVGFDPALWSNLQG